MLIQSRRQIVKRYHLFARIKAKNRNLVTPFRIANPSTVRTRRGLESLLQTSGDAEFIAYEDMTVLPHQTVRRTH